VEDYKNSTIYFKKHPDYPIEKGFEYRHSPDGNSTIYKLKAGYGYYFDNKFELLDSVGEWYQDLEESKIYYYPGNNNPREIEGTVYDFGIYLKNVEFIVIDNLHIDKYAKGCIHVEGKAGHLKITNNTITNSSRFGINLGIHSSFCEIINNTLKNTHARCITGAVLSNTIIADNTIKNVGIIPGYGWSGNFSPIGIMIHNIETKIQKPPFSHDNVIRHNYIDSCGYSGIRLDGYNNTCEYNHINNCMLTLMDGGAIYSFARQYNVSYNNKYRHNIIMNTRGYAKATPSDHSSAIAIYMDNYTHNMLIENNTILNNTNAAGILINDASNRNTIRGNNFYNNDRGILFSEWKVIGGNYDNLVEDNTVYCKTPNQKAVIIANHKVGLFSPAVLKNNAYCSLVEKFYFKYQTYHKNYKNIKELDGEGWKLEVGEDLNSHFVGIDMVDVYKEGGKIFYNDTRENKIIDLSNSSYFGFDGKKIQGKFTLEPFSSIILLQQ
jgi:parallel beta-helix repeat protein